MRNFKIVLSLFFFFCLFSSQVICQFSSVKIGVNGITCSACTKSVQTSIRKLPFVENVEMNLENTSGNITFKRGQMVKIELIAKAVVDAGFSIRYLTADYYFSHNDFSSNQISENNYSFYFIRTKPGQKNVSLRFVGPDFQTKKEYAKFKNEFPEIDFKKNGIYYVIPFVK